MADFLTAKLASPEKQQANFGRIYCWNVNGIRSVLRNGLFEKFMTEAKPDILCLQETKIDSIALEKEWIPQWLSQWFPPKLQYWNCCKIKRGYSGTAILISKNFCGGAPLNVDDDFGRYGLHDQEGRTITCHFKDFILVTTYVPHSGGPALHRLEYRVNSWDKDFQHYLKEDLEVGCGKPVIMCGDLNVAHEPIDSFELNRTKTAC